MTTAADRRKRVLTFARSPQGLQFQFGQNADNTTWGGLTACGHTAVQFLTGLWTGRRITQDDVSHAVGYPDVIQKRDHIGLYGRQVIAALKHFGVHYELRTDLSERDLVLIAHDQGPVLFKCIYGYWPEDLDAIYGNVHADGKPNGYARPLGRAGKTQLYGFEDGYHWGVLLAYYSRGPKYRERVYLRDSNHASAYRPEKPPYDVVSDDQFGRLYRSWLQSKDKCLYALVPKGTL